MTRYKRPLANEIMSQQGLYNGSYNEYLHSEEKKLYCICFVTPFLDPYHENQTITFKSSKEKKINNFQIAKNLNVH
jgi:hypothetical protein